MSDTEVCPDCEATQIHKNRPRGEPGRRKFSCSACGAAFDEPDNRKKKSDVPAGAGSSLAAQLAEMNADDAVGGVDGD